MHSNLAKNIFRKRLIIEAKYEAVIESGEFVSSFLKNLSDFMQMTIIAGPFISSATGKSVPLHDGYEGALVWAESGVNTYIWTNSNFCTVDIYSCKEFDSKSVIEFIKKEFKITDFSYQELPDPQSKDDSRIDLREIEGKGVGVFATDFIPKGTIVSYVDGQIHFAEKESNVGLYAENHAVPFHKNLYRNGFNTSSVLLNHSCEPNCYVKDLFFVTTMRDIQKDEELTYSYSLFCNSDWDHDGPCLCGADSCLGKITPWRDLPKELQKKYINYTADWILFDEIKKKYNIIDLLDHK